MRRWLFAMSSTLTQQLARNLYREAGRAPTRTRKIKEAITALKIEAVHSKDEILEAYLKTVPFDLKDAQARDYPAQMCSIERLTTRFCASYDVEHALRCTPFSQEPYGKP